MIYGLKASSGGLGFVCGRCLKPNFCLRVSLPGAGAGGSAVWFLMQVPVFRSEILKEQPHLTSQNISSYSKPNIVWNKGRSSVNGLRTYDSYSESICLRSVGVAVTEANSPFFAPQSKKNDANVVQCIDALNERYMFVVEEPDKILLQIHGAIKMSCVCRNPVCAEGLAYLLLGMEGTAEDMAMLSSMLHFVDLKRMQWRLIPNAEASINVPSVAGLLSPKGCTSVQLYAPVVLRHITVHDGSLYDIVLHGKHQDVNETSIGPSPAESSSGWEGVVSSDASSRRWFGSAMVGPRLDRMRGMTSSSDTSDTRISFPSRVPPSVVEELDMHQKMKKMLSPRMYQAVCLLQMPQKSWYVAGYFAIAAVVVGCLTVAMTDIGGDEAAFLFFANFGPTLFSYAYMWNSYAKTVDVWYSIYSVLSEERRKSCTAKWESRCKMWIVAGTLASLGGVVMRTRRIIFHHPDMVLNVPLFCSLSGLMWLLNIVQICLVSHGITCFLFTCRLSMYDISESKFTARNFAQFVGRCAKIHKFRMVTFILFFVTICFEMSFIWHAFLETLSVKYFIFLPFGVILPQLSNESSGLGALLWTLGLTVPLVVMFLRVLYASMWAAKAKAERQVQLSGDLQDKFIASSKISGWFFSHQLVRWAVCVLCFGCDTQCRM